MASGKITDQTFIVTPFALILDNLMAMLTLKVVVTIFWSTLLCAIWCFLLNYIVKMFRYTVGKITPVPAREVRSSDFGDRARIRMYFPRAGSKLTPPHCSINFYWKDYCPMVFRYVLTLLSTPCFHNFEISRVHYTIYIWLVCIWLQVDWFFIWSQSIRTCKNEG